MKNQQALPYTNKATLPQIGFGTWDVRGSIGKKVLLEALSVGYRLIDTAEMYGNEDIAGAAVRESGIDREEIFVTSKISHECRTARETVEAVKESLRKMGLDYLELMLIHEPYGSYEVMYEGLEEALSKGLVRHIGVSNFNEGLLATLLESAHIRPFVNQIESHVYYPQLDFAKKMKEKGIQMQSWGPFTEGRRDIFHEKILLEIGEEHNKTAGQIALRYLTQNGICVIPKSSKRSRMEENLNIFDFELTEEDMKKIAALDEGESLFGWY